MDFSYILENFNFVNIFWQLGTPLIFMLGDIISGVVQAIINKNLDSKIMREGLLRKGLLILILFLAFIVEHAFGVTFISKVVSLYIIVMEIISIAENVQKAGVDLGKLGNLLKSQEQKESEDDKNA